MLKIILIACVAFVDADAALARPKPPADQVEAAERAFAADGLAWGVKRSFLKHMADDAIIFTPHPINARAFYEARAAEAGPKLEWWPAWVVAARSGDLALSTGPSFFDGKPGGWFSSIWRKDADGTWRWIYDGGSAADALSAPARTTPAVKGVVSGIGEGSPAKAFDAVRAAEEILSQTAQKDAAQAYKAILATDAHLLGPRGARALPPTAVEARLNLRAATMRLVLRGGGASRAGDLVWTHGEATWDQAGQNSVQAHYMHVWQKRPEGWRLIFETLINDR
jgi:ketosteroid isomerase-like protein